MKLENQLEAILLSIQMECLVALSFVRNGEYKKARSAIDSIDMSCWHAFKHLDDHDDAVMDAQDRAHLKVNNDIPW